MAYVGKVRYNCDKTFAGSYGATVEVPAKVRAALVKRNDIRKSENYCHRLYRQRDFAEQRGATPVSPSTEIRIVATLANIDSLKQTLNRIVRSMSPTERRIYNDRVGENYDTAISQNNR